MKTIPLTQGKVALVDDEDYDALAAHRWYAKKSRGSRFYAVRNGPQGRGPRQTVLMHAAIAGTPTGMVTDHIDRDGLNNQRSNLRVCNIAENASNRGKNKNNSTGFKGVGRHPRHESNLWVAQIWKLNRRIHLGVFPTAEAAARAYDEAAPLHHGKFAVLNFPPEEE